MGNTSSLICDVRHHLHSGWTKEEGRFLEGSKSWSHGVPPLNIVQCALSPLPFPCIPTTVFATPSAHQGLRAWRLQRRKGLQLGVVPHAMTGGCSWGEAKGTRTNLVLWAGWFVEMGLAHCCFLGLWFGEGERIQHKTLRASDPNNENLRTVVSSPFVF